MAEMRCDQCGRLLTPSEVRAGVCPSCGRPILNAADAADQETAAAFAGDDSGTRPIAPAQPSSPPLPTAPPPPPADALTAPATPISPYRPPALPRATPTTSAPAEPAVAAADERTAAMPAHLLPAEADIAASGARERKGGRFGWASALALLIVLVLGAITALLAANGQLAGILGETSSTPTAVPSATPTAGPPAPPTGFARYPASSFSIIYPSGWVQVVQPGGLVAFTSPGTGANLQVQISNQGDPQSLDDVYISGLGTFLLHDVNGTSAVSGKTAPAPFTAAGVVWTREEADVAVTSGGTTTAWHVAALAVTHGQQTYLISFYAPTTAFAAQDGAFFEPMVNSFLFVSQQP
ncbi:MAG TPA: hypothetical protein VIG30_05085 [Ktedonobacterales bacterium]